ncbi:MAG: MFS transporter [Campylobacterota bacterium]|nr:MFS transporter [Campylobacterota bacterium]
MSILFSSFYFFYFSVVGVYIIFLPKVLSMLGYSASEIGIIFAVAPMVRFLLPFAFIKGLKLNAIAFNIALIFMLVSSISFYFTNENFTTLILSNIGLGIGLSLVLPYIEVIALEEIGKQKYGKVRLFGSIGFVLVALILVRFLNSTDIAFLFLMTLSFFTSIFAFFIVKTSSHQEKQKKQSIQNDIDILKDWKLWLGLTLMQVSFGSFYNFFTIYETDFGISLDMTIYLWTFGVLAEIVMLYFQGRLLSKNLLLILQISIFLTAIRWFLVFLYPQNLSILFFSQAIHAFSFALFHSTAIVYLFGYYKHRSLAQQFFLGITYGLGGFLGALLAGFIYEHIPNYLFLSSSLLALGAFYFIYIWSKNKIK